MDRISASNRKSVQFGRRTVCWRRGDITISCTTLRRSGGESCCCEEKDRFGDRGIHDSALTKRKQKRLWRTSVGGNDEWIERKERKYVYLYSDRGTDVLYKRDAKTTIFNFLITCYKHHQYLCIRGIILGFEDLLSMKSCTYISDNTYEHAEAYWRRNCYERPL